MISPDEIAQCVLNKFNQIPKKGKPAVKQGKHEWTVLAGIIKTIKFPDNPMSTECVAIGTGLKCLGSKELAEGGFKINDSHAEIVCRRGFMGYLLYQMELTLDDNSNIFEKYDTKAKKYILNDGVSFHLYISQAACGDATMQTLESTQTTELKVENEKKKRKYMKEIGFDEEGSAKRINSDVDDIDEKNSSISVIAESGNFDTSLLKLDIEPISILRGRNSYQTLGVLRTKPGRIDADSTKSMSCSDKIARWNVVGLTGGLLAHLLDPIYLENIVMGDLYDEVSSNRAFNDRIGDIKGLPKSFKLNYPRIRHTRIGFEFSKGDIMKKFSNATVISSDTSISWYIGSVTPDVIVNGIKQGFSLKKHGLTGSSR